MHDGSHVAAGVADPFIGSLARGSGGAAERRLPMDRSVETRRLPIRGKPAQNGFPGVVVKLEQGLLRCNAAAKAGFKFFPHQIPDETEKGAAAGFGALAGVFLEPDAREQMKFVSRAGASHI